MPRFVILEHDWPALHWDLMLEAGATLRTWRLDAPPQLRCTAHATAIGDHRPIYLDYEGPLTGDRGRVRRWDAGTFEWIRDDAQSLEITLSGTRCAGRLELRRVAQDAFEVRLTA